MIILLLKPMIIISYAVSPKSFAPQSAQKSAPEKVIEPQQPNFGGIHHLLIARWWRRTKWAIVWRVIYAAEAQAWDSISKRMWPTLLCRVTYLRKKALYSACRMRPLRIMIVWKHCLLIAHNLHSVTAVIEAVRWQLYSMASSPSTTGSANSDRYLPPRDTWIRPSVTERKEEGKH